MQKYSFSDLSLPRLRSLVQLHEKGVVPSLWTALMRPYSVDEQQRIEQVTTYLLNYQLSLMNEATIWSRAIYPLLLLAEQSTIQAWAQVPLKATYPQFELEGLVDGVLGNAVSGVIESPYLLVVKAKRGLEATNPQFQLYGEILAAAKVNWQQTYVSPQEMFGCYTIGDSWTFVRGVVDGFETDYPTLTLEFSREYAERIEAETIFQILKGIVDQFIQTDRGASKLVPS